MSKKGSITTADYLQYEEFKRLLQCLENDRQYLWKAYCVLSFCFGLRSSDVRKLKWIDVINQRSITVTEKKTKKVRRIPIGNSTSEIIREIYDKLECPLLNKYIFESSKTGQPVSIQYINRITKIWKLRYDLDIDNFSTHTFRKTFGRYFYERRGKSAESLLELQKIFRHHDTQTTLIYIGITDDHISKVFEDIEL